METPSSGAAKWDRLSPQPRPRRRRAKVVIVLGIALILSGAILIFVPVVPQASHAEILKFPPGNYDYFLRENISGFSVTGFIPVDIPWNSNGSMDVVAAACVHYCSNQSQLPSSSIVYETLVNASAVFLWVPNGGSIFVAWYQQTDHPPSSSLSYTVWTGLTPAGPILLVSGSAGVVLGISFRRVDAAKPPPTSYGPRNLP